MAGEGEIQEFQAAGHTPHLLALDQLLVRARLQQPEIRLLQDRAVRLHGPHNGLLALRQRLRHPVTGPEHGHELLALAEPRGQGTQQTRLDGHKEDKPYRRLLDKRLV